MKRYDKFATTALVKSLKGRIPFLIDLKVFNEPKEGLIFVLFKSKAGILPSYYMFTTKSLDRNTIEEIIREERYYFMNIVDGSVKPTYIKLSIILKAKWRFNNWPISHNEEPPVSPINLAVKDYLSNKKFNKKNLIELMEKDF